MASSSGGDVELPALSDVSGGPVLFSSSGSDGKLDIGTLTTIVGPAAQDNDTTLEADGGGTLTASDLATIGGADVVVEASNTGSLVSLPALKTITADTTNLGSLTEVEAVSGGDVELPALSNVSGGPVLFESYGTGSELNIATLASIVGPSGQNNVTSLQVSSGGSLLASSLSSVSGVDLAIETSGASSQVSLPKLATIADAAVGTIALEALSGGELELVSLQQITGPAQVESDGTGSLLDIPDLSGISVSDALTIGTGGSIHIGGLNVTLPVPGTGVTVNIPTLPVGVPIDLFFVGAYAAPTFNVAAGDIISITSGDFNGGMTFNVAQGATVNVGGGASGSGQLVVSGALSGSGAGTVQFVGGQEVGLDVGLGGLTLDFSGTMFNWVSGVVTAAGGAMYNTGTLNIDGGVVLTGDGTLDNSGTILESSGSLRLHSDGVAPSTLINEKGASYIIDSGADFLGDGGPDNIVNAGLFVNDGGTGMSTIDITGSITNTGTIAADSGTLVLDPASLIQLSGGDLSGGTWAASNGATLDLPGGTSITSSQATLALDGSGSSISGTEGLSSNSGSLSVTGGATFTTTGDFADSGSLTIGAGSVLSVSGNYTQTSSASLTVGIGGTTSTSQYGQLAITGGATLAGSVNASTPSGFTPSAGTSYPIIIYASETGGSSVSFTGLNSGGVSILQPKIGSTSLTLNTVTSPAYLVVQPFRVAANAVAGQNLSVTYQVDNESANAASGTWTDSVYLSTQTTLNSNSVLLGRVQQSGVAANVQYTQTVTAPVTGLAPDDYYVIVLADSLGLVPELNRASTELASTNPVQITRPHA